jgi:putative nucleotidyltransferase-like protein
MMQTNSADRPIATLLALCARAHGHPAHEQRLAQLVRQLPTWEGVAGAAEAHGLAPLLYTHLQAAGAALPIAVKQELQGYYLQHAHANRVRGQVLGELLAAYRAAGIDVLVLKGAALAQLVYPQPGLRPMRDIDLLVRAPDAPRAQALLVELGFTPPLSPGDGLPPDHHHLAASKRTAEGQQISVEVHHALNLNEPDRPPRSFAEFAPTARTFVIHGATAATLSYEDTLWHIYRHGFCMPLGSEPPRLIWAADLVSLVERMVEVLDWERVRRQYRAVYAILPLLHHLTPWSDQVLDRLRLPVTRAPARVGHMFQGWPQLGLVDQWPKGLWRILGDSLFPSPWWLRLYYGQGPSLGGYWRAWSAHQRSLWPQIGIHAQQHTRRLFRLSYFSRPQSAILNQEGHEGHEVGQS